MRNAAKATSSCFMTSLVANRSSRILLDAVDLRIPFQAELRGRRHITGKSRRGHDGRAGQVSFAADAHPVLPVPVERGNRAFAFRKCIGPLAETGTAPRCADFAAN